MAGVPASPTERVLALDCPEASGIVPEVPRFLVEHGVKAVGAPADHVTAGLDEGPVTAREVSGVGHRHGTLRGPGRRGPRRGAGRAGQGGAPAL